jgi:ABC-type nitrate/sulfonate/bicarbonate transport system substrate-binding protein
MFLDGDVSIGGGFLRAYLRGVRRYRAGHTPRALERLAEMSGMTPAAVQNACRDRLPEDGRVDPASVQRLIDWAVRNGFAPQRVEAADMIDTRFLDQAHAGLTS